MSKDQTKNTAGHALGARPATLVMRLLGFVVATALLVPAVMAQAAAGAPNCTAEQGQAFIDMGSYEHAIHEFTCLVDAQPTEVEGYRGRIEAELLLGRYSDALADYGRVTAVVEPVHPDAHAIIRVGYADRLAIEPHDITALTGASFERWANFDYAQTLHLLEQLLDVDPNHPYGRLFRGSSRLLQGGPGPKVRGEADLARAIELAPESPDVRFIVADAYTYGMPDFERAFAEASLALSWGLDTARVNAILAAAYNVFGDLEAAATHIERHFELVTTESVTTSALPAGESLTLDLVPGRIYEIPIAVTAGETISIATSSKDYWDSIAVLLAPDGSPVVGSDDEIAYHAAFDWVAEETGTYLLKVAFFEAWNRGELVVKHL